MRIKRSKKYQTMMVLTSFAVGQDFGVILFNSWKSLIIGGIIGSIIGYFIRNK